MHEWLSTFVAGFEPLVEALAPTLLQGASRVRVSGGLVTYQLERDPRSLPGAGLFSHTFAVLKRFRDESFPTMARATAGVDFRAFTRPGQSFRVRFHDRGRFTAVDSAVTRMAEEHVLRMAKLRVDRVSPDVEFWYIRRADGTGFYALLFSRRESREPARGELKPELALGMCLLAGLSNGDAMADPFAGSGAIVAQAVTYARLSTTYASDMDGETVKRLRGRLGNRATVFQADARALSRIADGCLDAIITDPPWGLFEAQSTEALAALYGGVASEFRRILKPNGRLVLLTAATHEIEAAAHEVGFQIRRKLPILVNGKKAILYRME